jgi:hypothetical protein
LSAAEARSQLLQDLVVARSLDQKTASRRASLARVLDNGVDDDRQRRIEVGVGENDLRSLAAKLQRDGTVALRGFGRRPMRRSQASP